MVPTHHHAVRSLLLDDAREVPCGLRGMHDQIPGRRVARRVGRVERRLPGEDSDGVPAIDEFLGQEVGGELRASDGRQVRLCDEQDPHRARSGMH